MSSFFSIKNKKNLLKQIIVNQTKLFDLTLLSQLLPAEAGRLDIRLESRLKA